jgi:BolA protein
MSRQETIEQKLSVLKPQYLKVINDSHLHSNHASSPNNGQSHFTVKISANSIATKQLLEQHKIINNLLKEEFTRGLHALSIIIVGK